MCAHLATVAPEELGLNSYRAEQFVRAYVGESSDVLLVPCH